MNETSVKPISDKRRWVAGILLFSAIVIMTNAEWNEFTWYQAVTPYGTLFSAVILAACFFCVVNIKDALRDPVFYMMAALDVLSLINLYLADSHYGAILTIADFLLVCYLANKLVYDGKMMVIVIAYCAFFFFYWTVDVKGYFKGYNTNYGGLILITGFACLLVLMQYVREYLQKKGGKSRSRGKWIWLVLELFFVALGYNIIAWYRSRCALVGYVICVILLVLPKKIYKSKVIWALACILSTFGAVLVSAVYVWLDAMRDVFTIRVFYKDILSGREELWRELWEAYLKQPFIGIGSSYEFKLDFMKGVFEVHNGMLDILFVHGLVVFLFACTFLCIRLWRYREVVMKDTIAKNTFGAMMAILVTSYFENFVIVPPFLLIFLALFAVLNGRLAIASEI